MQITQSHKPFNKVDYYPLSNGYVDVFLHKTETQETDEDGGIFFKAEEVYFQVSNTITKQDIEEGFDFYWKNEGAELEEGTLREEVIEDYLLDLDMRILMIEYDI